MCSHDCPDSCAVLVTVNEEGRAVKVEGDPKQPVTQEDDRTIRSSCPARAQ